MSELNFYQTLEPNLSFNQVVKASASSDEVIKEIVSVANEYKNSKFVQQVVKSLSYSNPDEKTFLKRLFQYACHAVKYQMDPAGHEIVFTPMLLIKHGHGDCKKFSTFISSVLLAKGITPVLRVCSYAGEDWEHIYVIVPEGKDYITLDPVNKCQYNKEVNSKYCRDYYLDGTKSKIIPMNKLSRMGNLGEEDNMLSGMLSGLALSADNLMADMSMQHPHKHLHKHLRKHCRCHHTPHHIEKAAEHFAMRGEELEGMSGMGRKHHAPKQHRTKAEKKARRKKFFHKLTHAGAKLAFAVNRAAFLGLILLGKALLHSPLKLNLANKLAHAYSLHKDKINDFWAKFGGEPKKLQKAILKGTKSGAGVHGIGVEPFTFDFNDHRAIAGMAAYLEMSGMAGIGVYTAAAAAATLAAASPIVIALVKILKDHKIIAPHEADHIEGTVTDVVDAAQEGGHVVDSAVNLAEGKSNDLQSNPIINSGAQEKDAGHELITAPQSPEAQEQRQEAQNFKQASDTGGNADASNENSGRTPSHEAKELAEAEDKPAAHAAGISGMFAINTWVKFSFLASTYTSINPSYIVQICCVTAYTGLTLVLSHKLIKRFKNKRTCTN